MFDEFRGLPLHVLVVHGAVVLVPLSALLAMGYAVPRLRRALRWPLLVAALAALGVVFVARQSGLAFRSALTAQQRLGGSVADLVHRHATLGTQLLALMVGFTVVVLVAVFTLNSARTNAVVRTVVAAVLVVGAVAVTVQTIRTGEAGSRAVWNPTGTAHFDSGR